MLWERYSKARKNRPHTFSALPSQLVCLYSISEERLRNRKSTDPKTVMFTLFSSP